MQLNRKTKFTFDWLIALVKRSFIGPLTILIPLFFGNSACGGVAADSKTIQADLAAQEIIGLKSSNEIVIAILLLVLSFGILVLWLRHHRFKRSVIAKTLLQANALQNAIFESTNFSIIATDPDGIIQIYSVGAERLLGYKASDVINKLSPLAVLSKEEIRSHSEQVSKEFGVPIAANFQALIYKAQRVDEDIYEINKKRSDGSSVSVVLSVTALRDAKEAIIGYLFIGTDNTVRKQAEIVQAALDKRISDLQVYTRSLIESNTDAIVTTDPHGFITDINHQMEELTSSTRDEIIGKPFKQFFTDQLRAEAVIKQVLLDGNIRNFELTALAKNGLQTQVSYSATTLFDRENKLQGVFAAARDITDRKIFEQTLENNNIDLKNARATADKANLAKSEFLSNMSHELRTPLNAVLGFAQLLASETPPPTPVQQLSIDQILQAGWYLLRLINEILDLALIESGKVLLSQESLSLNEVLQECQTMIGPQAKVRSIELQFQADAQPFYVSADRTRLKQILFNLLSNAIKYSPRGSEVRVLYSPISSDRVRVSVIDCGAGLSPVLIEQLFQPFNRLGQEGNSSEGTGIGLVVTKRLVELMGGRIGVDSRVGVGSTFWFELATAPPPHLDFEQFDKNDLSAHPTDRTPPDLFAEKLALTPKWKVLYVEDNPANLILVQQLLARRGDIQLLSAIDGYAGIEIAKTHIPDLILMDIHLPGISGTTVLKILKNDLLTAHIPVIAISANALSRDIDNGLQAGFFHYLTKPINVKEFMEVLDITLQKVVQ